MQHFNPGRSHSTLVWASRFAAWGLTACAVSACGGQSTGDADRDDPVVQTTRSALAEPGTCADDALAGQGWVNDAMPAATASFTLELTAYPSTPDGTTPTLDGTIGLSNGAASTFAALGPIVRFNADGDIDARNGDTYAALERVQYRPGFPYSIRMIVDIESHTYSVWVKERAEQGKPFTQIAEGYAFRSEQSGVERLDNVARFVDGTSGTLAACSFLHSSPSQ